MIIKIDSLDNLEVGCEDEGSLCSLRYQDLRTKFRWAEKKGDTYITKQYLAEHNNKNMSAFRFHTVG